MSKLLLVILALSIHSGINAAGGINADPKVPTPESYLQNKLINAAVFPLFAATAYYFFDEANESYDHFRSFVAKKFHSKMIRKRSESKETKAINKRLQFALLLKELDKQTFYLVGVVGASVLTWALRTQVPDSQKIFYLGGK